MIRYRLLPWSEAPDGTRAVEIPADVEVVAWLDAGAVVAQRPPPAPSRTLSVAERASLALRAA